MPVMWTKNSRQTKRYIIEDDFQRIFLDFNVFFLVLFFAQQVYYLTIGFKAHLDSF